MSEKFQQIQNQNLNSIDDHNDFILSSDRDIRSYHNQMINQEHHRNQNDINDVYSPNQKRNGFFHSKSQSSFPSNHPHYQSNQNILYSSIDKTVNMRTPQTNSILRVSQKYNQDDILTQGKSNISIQEQYMQLQQTKQSQKTQPRIKNRNIDDAQQDGSDQLNKQIFNNNNLFFIVGELYKKIQEDELFKTLKTDETSRDYLHYRVQEIVSDSYVKSLIHTLKEMQTQLNYHVDENNKLQEMMVVFEEKQLYYNGQLNKYQQKCISLEQIMSEIQVKDEERNQEIRQVYQDRNNQEKVLSEKYELLQEQYRQLEKKNNELLSQLKSLQEQYNEINEEKKILKDQIEQKQVSQQDLNKLNIELKQKEQEVQNLQNKIKEQNDNFAKETEEINEYYEKEMKQIKQQRKKEKEMYENIIQEKQTMDIVQNQNQSNLIESLHSQISQLQQKLLEAQEVMILMQQENKNLQQQIQDEEQAHEENIESIKNYNKAEITDMQQLQDKFKQINEELQKDYELLKQQKQMNEVKLQDKHSLDRQLLNDQIQNLNLEHQAAIQSRDSLGQDLIEITQYLEKEKNENQKLIYKIQLQQDIINQQDSFTLQKTVEELKNSLRNYQTDQEYLVSDNESLMLQMNEKDEIIKQKSLEHQEIIKRLTKAQQKFDEVERRMVEAQEEKNNLYKLLDSKGKEIQRLEQEIQQIQKEKDSGYALQEATIQQLNQHIKHLSEQKDSKSMELRNLSKDIMSVQKELEHCREINMQGQQKLMSYEQEEKILKELEQKQKEIIMSLSNRIESLEFEIIHIREDYENKENIYKDHYESQLEKMHQQINEGISMHLQNYANQSNIQLIQILKDNQIEIQEQEALVNKQYAEINHLKIMNESLNKKMQELITLKKQSYSPQQYEAVIRENQYLKETNKSFTLNQESLKKNFNDASVQIQKQFSQNLLQSPKQHADINRDFITTKKLVEQQSSLNEQITSSLSEQISTREQITSPRGQSTLSKEQQTLTLPRQVNQMVEREFQKNKQNEHHQVVMQKLESTQSYFISIIQGLNKQHQKDSDEIKSQYSRMKNSQAQDKKSHSLLKQQFTLRLMELRQQLYGEIKDSLINYRKEISAIKDYAEQCKANTQDLNSIEQIEMKTEYQNNQIPNQEKNVIDHSPMTLSQKSQNSNKISPSNIMYNSYKNNNSLHKDKYLKQFSIEEEESSLSESNYQGSSEVQSDMKQSFSSSFQKKINF